MLSKRAFPHDSCSKTSGPWIWPSIGLEFGDYQLCCLMDTGAYNCPERSVDKSFGCGHFIDYYNMLHLTATCAHLKRMKCADLSGDPPPAIRPRISLMVILSLEHVPAPVLRRRVLSHVGTERASCGVDSISSYRLLRCCCSSYSSGYFHF